MDSLDAEPKQVDLGQLLPRGIKRILLLARESTTRATRSVGRRPHDRIFVLVTQAEELRSPGMEYNFNGI